MARRKEPRIPDAVLDQLLAGADPKTVFDPNGLLDDLKKALADRHRRREASVSAVIAFKRVMGVILGRSATAMPR